jgi:putative heme transporter
MASAHDRTTDEAGPGMRRLWRAGRSCWALLGIAIVVAALGFVAQRISLVLVAAVLALFPATLLSPLADRLKRVMPDALAALLSIVAALLVFAAIIGAMVPLVAAELPALAQSASEGVADIDELLADGIFGVQLGGVSDLLDTAREQLGEAGDIAGQAAGAATAAIEVVTGLLLTFVILFFYLKDGSRLSEGVIRQLPERHHGKARAAASEAWATLRGYFRGQITVAFVDAVAIGLGLVLLGVPLALPLSVLILFGGLFPIVGAVVSGGLAVLVALADTGLTTALIVLALVVGVQQLESNVLEPIILGRAIELHALVVILAITAGSLAFGLLGAFLAVPVAATIGRVINVLRGDTEEAEDDAGAAAAAPA